MKLSLILAALGSIGIVACASPSAARGAAAAATLAKPTADVVRVEQTRVVAARIHPLVPVRATVEGDVISIRYGRGSRAGAVAHLSSGSLSPVAPEAQVEGEAPTLPSTEARRVALRGGRFVECFLVGSTERGFRLMAQEWSSRGSRLGLPVPISPPDADVMAAPQLVAIDGQRAVATFVATYDEHYELLAVAMDVL